MYEVVLSIHNVMRWVVLVLAILAVVRAFRGWLGRREWTPADRRTGSFLAMTLDIQFLLGLLLYFVLSPITTEALRDFGAAMRSPDMRFFALEHALYMFLAVVFGHLGNALPRRVEQAVAKHRRAAIWFGLAFLVLLIGMPWMRPLLRI